jgi:hypothetical protein
MTSHPLSEIVVTLYTFYVDSVAMQQVLLQFSKNLKLDAGFS